MTITEQALRVRRYRLNTPLSSRCQAPAASSAACSRRPERAAQTCKIASAARPTSVALLGVTTQGGHHLSPLLLVRHHGVADADRTVLRAAAGGLQPQHVINLPFWSTLMLDLDAC